MAGPVRADKPMLLRIVATGAVAGLATTMLVETTAGGAGSSVSSPAAKASSAAPRLDPLLPDLTPLRPVDVSISKSGGARVLRFEAGLASIGTAPIEVRPDRRLNCPRGKQGASQVIFRDVDRDGKFRRSVDKKFSRRSAGCMVFHPHHNHWHFQAASRYAIYRAGEPQTTIQHARKMSFCLRDSKRVPRVYGTFHTKLHYRDCSQTAPQGISRGWVDVYASYLSGQSIVLPKSVNRGIFCLAVRVDPLGHLRETDETNNRSFRALHIHGTRASFAKQKHCR